MKYSELIQFEPLNEVVKFNRLSDDAYRENLVKTYVFSKAYEDTIIPEVCKNLDYTAMYDTFGLQIVGTYGTGKSHLMSLISLVAENADYLPLVQNEKAAQVLKNIAGKYRIIRFELGSADELWNLICHQIDLKFQEWGIHYSIAADTKPDMYKDKLMRMMAQFEVAFPDKGLMIVIDEMLSYLKGRSGTDKLNRDLAVIQALGEMSDHSKFRMVFGVQELIYTAAEFQFAAKMLNQVSQRYRQIEITKQDVQFVTEQRILKKSDAQKQAIRKHLSKFTEFFTDLHANLESYVDLFPVNPSFFENFQQIKIGKSQREILKTLSQKFEKIANQQVPEDNPGLICYDSYWEDLQAAQMQTYADVRRVTEIMQTIHQKIDDNFTGIRAKKAPLAHRIANACGVKVLQDSLEKTNGTNVENLVDDLCYLDAGCISREFLIDTMNVTASQIVTATVGQYFEKNDTNQEYHIRVEGGVNYEQKIKDFANTMSADNKDSHFFDFLAEYLPIDAEQYRREFKIYQHRIDWNSHKVMLDGYIFMGNPAERSTTHPEQNFYIYFMPIFNKENIKHGDEADSVFFHMEHFSDEFKQLIELYAASEALYASVDSSQKPFYLQFKKQYEDKLKPVFNRDFVQCTEVYYQGEKQNITPQMMTGGSKEQVVSNIASLLLEDYFCDKLPNYPKFTLLKASLTSMNRADNVKRARMKIANPTQSNHEGEAILAGLGLLKDNQLSVEGSIYALSIKKKLEDKGQGQVLNRDEILYRFYKDWENDWRSLDYHLESDLEFLAMATLVAMGEIEIDYPGGKNINAANLREIVDLPFESFYSFSHVRRPKGITLSAVRELFWGVTGKDMTSQLQNPDIYLDLVSQAKAIAANSVKCSHDLGNGIYLGDVEIIGGSEATTIKSQLTALAGLCDRIPSYASYPKMRNLPQDWTADVLHNQFKAKEQITSVKQAIKFKDEFLSRITYLNEAMKFMLDDKMKASAETSLAKISQVVADMNNETAITAYKTELDTIIRDYAKWYFSEYQRMHITEIEDTEKRRIMNDNNKKVCDAVCGADYGKGFFSVATQYTEWQKKMNSLAVVPSYITPDYIMKTPNVGFDPKDFQGKQLPKLSELKEELDGIATSVDDTLKQILSDETLLVNKDILDDSQQGLLSRYTSGGEELSPANAGRLVDIVVKLHEGIQRITISEDDIRKVLNRPMTPEDAIKAFRKYINSLTVGGQEDNIRIILK